MVYVYFIFPLRNLFHYTLILLIPEFEESILELDLNSFVSKKVQKELEELRENLLKLYFQENKNE